MEQMDTVDDIVDGKSGSLIVTLFLSYATGHYRTKRSSELSDELRGLVQEHVRSRGELQMTVDETHA
jgi:hypothetical protein